MVKKIGLHPLFAVVCVLVLCMGLANVLVNFLLAVILHEFAHGFIASKKGYKLNKFFLMPYGAGLNFQQNFVDEKDEIIIASAGPIFSFALALLFTAFWWIFPASYIYTHQFVFANIVTGTLNLLPAYPLDGGRILACLITLKTSSRKIALKFCFAFNYVFSFVFLVLFSIAPLQNITFLIFAIFIFLGTIDNKFTGNYTIKNFPFFENNLSLKQNVSINQFAVTAQTEIFRLAQHLKKNKLNIAVVVFEENKIKILSENIIKNLFEKYPSTTKINEIIRRALFVSKS